MRLPPTLKIGPHLYTVRIADHWKDIAPNTQGETFYESCEIYIKTGLPETEAFSTLMHEAMHVMNRTLDHTLLDSLSEQISQFLIDNQLLK